MSGASHDSSRAERERLVAELRAAGIRGVAVLSAIGRFPRHELVAAGLRQHAYENRPLPIGAGQTISQPYIVALMSEALHVWPGAKVLEVGTGSGYQAGILATMGARVLSLEIVPELAERARAALAAMGGLAVEVRVGDGYAGAADEAPFDGIIVTAAPRFVPPALLAQLAEGGRLVIPVGAAGDQVLEVFEKRGGAVECRHLVPVRFVPMTGEVEDVGMLH